MVITTNTKKLNTLFVNNEEAIKKHNAETIPKLALIGAFIAGMAVFGSFFDEYMSWARGMYLAVFVWCGGLYFSSKSNRTYKYPLVVLYMVLAGLYVLMLYLSIVLFRDRQAAAVLVGLTIFPVTYIDKAERIIVADFVMYGIHTILSYLYKDMNIARMDFVNGFVAVLVGTSMGIYILNIKLQALELARLLIAEKETDVLTGIYNRRKMTEMLEDINEKKYPHPDGVIMMDIDYFKNYNDTYGHAAGDDCLHKFGKMLKESSWNQDIIFYRYGGEEFIAFVWGADKNAMKNLTEQIQDNTRSLQLENGNITLSIGYVQCDDMSINNFENWIQRADIAAYKAKKNGRNCIVQY